MKVKEDNVSLRLLRKGAFTEETYSLFQQWDFSESMESNFDRILHGHFRTHAWSTEVKATIRRRFRAIDAATPLILMAKNGLPFEEWRSSLLLWVGTRERLYREFALNWLFSEFDQGTYQVRAEDVQPFVRKLWPTLNEQTHLTEYSVTRTARDLLRMAADFGLLAGNGPRKTFSPLHLSDRCFLYYAHVIAEIEKSTSRIPQSHLWKLALIRPDDVVTALLRLHQFRKVDYQVAGTLVELTLPCSSAREYVDRMVA
jgi:hypothetical protein